VPVHLIDPDRERSLQAVSDAAGDYSFLDLEPGRYLLTAVGEGLASPPAEVELSAGESASLDVVVEKTFSHSITVSATRSDRPPEEVPASVTVVGDEVLRHTPMTNLEDALGGIPGALVQSRNRGYDTRLMIRGAGLKARYGVREIMVLQDGVPITDPDSLTRLDLVDTHLVESVEVVRGPNSTLWGINATGGVINIRTRSPFAAGGGLLRADFGSDGSRNLEASFAAGLSDRHRLLASVSRRQADNSWRPWNEFSTTQLTLRPGLLLGDTTVWESTLSYSRACLQLPGSLVTDPRRSIDQWAAYVERGEVAETADPWRHSGRSSQVAFLGSALVHQVGAFDIKPTLYLSRWHHNHPVTARINDAENLTGGLDLQVDWRHGQGVVTGGVTFRADRQDGRAATYGEVVTTPAGRILATLSDAPGELMRVLDQKAVLAGAYIQDSLRPGARWLLDAGVRWDSVHFRATGNEAIDFDFATGRYIEGRGAIDYDFGSTAVSPRLGAVFQAGRTISLYGSVSTGTQTPTEGELAENPRSASTAASA
jgi:iron complex outermembrane receptor protein